MNNNIEEIISDSQLAFVQGRYDESLKLAKQAIQTDSNNAAAHQCAGNAYMSKSDLPSAILHYKKAIDLEEKMVIDTLILLMRMQWIINQP